MIQGEIVIYNPGFDDAPLIPIDGISGSINEEEKDDASRRT